MQCFFFISFVKEAALQVGTYSPVTWRWRTICHHISPVVFLMQSMSSMRLELDTFWTKRSLVSTWVELLNKLPSWPCKRLQGHSLWDLLWRKLTLADFPSSADVRGSNFCVVSFQNCCNIIWPCWSWCYTEFMRWSSLMVREFLNHVYTGGRTL